MKLVLAVAQGGMLDRLMLLLQRFEPGSEIQCAESVDAAVALLREPGTKHLALACDTIAGAPGLSSLERIVRAAHGTPIALVAADRSRPTVLRALAMGAAGVLRPNFDGPGLYHALKLMIAGESYVPATVLEEAGPNGAADAGHYRLSKREGEVLRTLLGGQTNKQVARDLGIEEVTVKLHLRKIYRKLGVRNRTQAVQLAMGMRL
jgi:DNA-binding NarL/FixJ family response regulator